MQVNVHYEQTNLSDTISVNDMCKSLNSDVRQDSRDTKIKTKVSWKLTFPMSKSSKTNSHIEKMSAQYLVGQVEQLSSQV